MQEIKVISSADEDKFAYMVNKMLSDGWKISSTACGLVNSERYDFCNNYQAILVREGIADEGFTGSIGEAQYARGGLLKESGVEHVTLKGLELTEGVKVNIYGVKDLHDVTEQVIKALNKAGRTQNDARKEGL